jgi:hypothetical protein
VELPWPTGMGGPDLVLLLYPAWVSDPSESGQSFLILESNDFC